MERKYPEPTVGALIINNSGEILLVKSPKWNCGYTIPGGHVELGEKIEDALKREIKEEVGIDIEVVGPLMVQEAIFPKTFFKKKHFIFLDYLCKAKNTEIKLDGREMTGFIWIKPEKALNLDIEPFTRNMINKYLENIKDKE